MESADNKNEVPVKKEATSLTVIKSIGLIVFVIVLANEGIWIGLGVGLLAMIVIGLLETFYDDSTDFVRRHLRRSAMKIVFWIIGIITAIILYILFSRSLFEGFISSIAVIILLLVLNRK